MDGAERQVQDVAGCAGSSSNHRQLHGKGCDVTDLLCRPVHRLSNGTGERADGREGSPHVLELLQVEGPGKRAWIAIWERAVEGYWDSGIYFWSLGCLGRGRNGRERRQQRQAQQDRKYAESHVLPLCCFCPCGDGPRSIGRGASAGPMQSGLGPRAHGEAGTVGEWRSGVWTP